jgi:DNA-binding NarL/FixJ family response regulator
MKNKSSIHPVKVVLADDHPIARRGLRTLLESDPTFRIVGEATDGIEALRLVEELNPGIAVVDISMPGQNGLDVTRKLRRVAPDVKVIILTMHFSEEVARECLRAGARAYVSKSDADEELLEALRAVRDDRPFLTSRITEMFSFYKGRQQCNPHAPRGLDGEIPLERLTMTEREILTLLCEGMTNAEVASKIASSTRTIELHRSNIMEKLQMTAFSDLVRYAVRHGIVLAHPNISRALTACVFTPRRKAVS